MKVGIVIDKLYPGKIGGAEQYVRNIISIMKKEKDLELVLFLNEEAFGTFENMESSEVQRVCVPYQLNSVKEFYEYYIAKYDIQILFCPLFYVPYEFCSVPIVVSILDIQHEYYPEYFTQELLQYRRYETRKSIENSSAIITISEFSKRTMIEKYNVEGEKIFVTHLNSDSSFEKELDEKKNAEMISHLPEHYIFYPANGWGHKNHKKLIDGYKILKEKYSTECKLVLTGNAFTSENGLHEYIQSLDLAEDIIALGYVEQEDMPYVFANADILAFPSLFEGFGIPLVEAMRVGTPIACSTCGSIPEIVGDAAVFFDANDEEDIADKLYTLEQSSELQNELCKRGKQRAEIFSWEKCAEQTLEILMQHFIKDGKEKQVPYYFPKVTILLPVFSNTDGVKKIIDSIEKQTYQNKDIIVFSSDMNVIKEVSNDMEEYDSNIKFIKAEDLYKFIVQNRSENSENIVGIFQSGQMIEDVCTLENIVLEFFKVKEDIFWIKPKKEGFWGIFLQNEPANEACRRFVHYDQVVNSIFFMKGERDKILREVTYWFYGHYQEEIFRYLIIKRINFRSICMPSILDRNPDLRIEAKKYRLSLWNLLIKVKYISPALLDRNDFLQNIFAYFLFIINASTKLKSYFTQIENKKVEFDGISDDGWISKQCKMEMEILDGKNCLEIRGENIALTEGAVLEIAIDKKKMISKKISAIGEFSVRAVLPDNIKEGKHFLRLRVNKTFSYYKDTQNDIRALSLCMKSISVNDNIVWELKS